MSKLDDQKVHELLVATRWRWASSAPYQTPIAAHSYTIREWTPDDIEFEAILRYTGDPRRSATRQFGSRKYREWTDPFAWPPVPSRFFGQVDRWFFWSMCPATMPATRHSQYASVLNRKPVIAMDLRPARRTPEKKPSKPQQLRLFEEV